MKRILFICLGNICRSPMAETIMQRIVDEKGLTQDFEIDSAGLISYHEGEQADPRMRAHASRHGYRITHLSRPIRTSDFRHFDLIIGMDAYNMADLRRLVYPADLPKVRRLLDFAGVNRDVADPWYTGNFDETYADVVAGCTALLQTLTC